uniref:Cytochrome P450 6PZ24 n=1 Tax=Maconellicoccus hirsutus TaxID=177089 RepID=A0AAT9UTQ8_MACHI
MYVLTSFLLSLVTLFLSLYLYMKKCHKFFEKSRIPHIKPHWFFGNMKDLFLKRKDVVAGYQDIYEELKHHRFAGFYMLHKPSIMICDPELIKIILVKDFSYFHERGYPRVVKEVEPLSNHVANMTGDEWKNLRIKLTGTFSSGKMKMMFPLVKKCAEGIKPALNKYYSDDEAFDAKDLNARFTTDVIGSCAFGIEANSLQDPDSEFRKMGKAFNEKRWKTSIRYLFPQVPVFLIKLLNLETPPPQMTNYFTNIVRDMIKYREENNITRGDFLDLLISMKNDKKVERPKDQNDDVDLEKFVSQIGTNYKKNDVEMTIELMAAQCFLFYAAGFEGASNTLMFLLYELAENPEIQNKLRNEIISAIDDNDGEFTYEMMRKLPYLEMVISETLRKHSIALFLIRKCSENYKIPDSEVVIKKGSSIVIPTFGLHFDTRYFEKPNDFYPEHFSDENKKKRPHYVYLPFGEGPRVCIAERFARMQITVGVVYLLKDFHYEVSPKTKKPLEVIPTAGGMKVKDGIWLKCRPL